MATVNILPWILLGAQWLLTAVGAALLFLLLLMVTALCLPAAFSVRAEGALDADESAEYGFTGELRWQLQFNFGRALVRADLQGENLRVTQKQMTVLRFRLRPRSGSARRTRKRVDSKRTQAPKRRLGEISLSRLRTYWAEGQWLLKRSAKALRMAVQGDITYGLKDPSLTGLTAAFLAAAGVPHGLRATPDFSLPGLRGWIALQGRTYGVRMLAAGTAFAFRPAIRHLWLSKLKHSIFRRKSPEGGRQAA